MTAPAADAGPYPMPDGEDAASGEEAENTPLTPGSAPPKSHGAAQATTDAEATAELSTAPEMAPAVAPDQSGESCCSTMCAILSPTLVVAGDYLGLYIITPSLPFKLTELCLNPERYQGYVMTSQFTGIIFANLFWAEVSKRYGLKRALQGTVAIGSCFFLGTAFCDSLASLVIVRFFAGCCSPLVPALTLALTNVKPTQAPAAVGYIVTFCVLPSATRTWPLAPEHGR